MLLKIWMSWILWPNNSHNIYWFNNVSCFNTVIDVPTRNLLASQTTGSFVLISFLDINLITKNNVCKQILIPSLQNKQILKLVMLAFYANLSKYLIQ